MRNRYWREPKKAKATRGKAWWYANPTNIEVYCDGGTTIIITRRQLEAYLRHTKEMT